MSDATRDQESSTAHKGRRIYVPPPLDTTGIQLPPELIPLLESLAENAHHVWARQRIGDGWKLGEMRDDAAKTHPCLVQYAELPDGEKEYDRILAREVLRFILGHGHRIVPPQGDHDSDRHPGDGDAPHSLERIVDDLRATTNVRRLIQIWSVHDSAAWRTHPQLYALLARRLITHGEPFVAQEVLKEGGAANPSDDALRYLGGLALARSGAPLAARGVALELAARLSVESPIFEDVQGLLGRVAKDLALEEKDAEQRRAWLVRSCDAYQHAFDVKRSSYSGINAATTALLIGEAERATSLARDVRQIALRELEHFGSDCFWQLATLGECALVLNDLAEARRCYSDASRCAGASWGDMSSTRRQARLISERQGMPTDWLDAAIPIPTVVVFAGHRIDGQRRMKRRFPVEAEFAVRAAIRRRLDELDAHFGFSGAASGAEILFQEEMLARGGDTYVVLPYDRDDYLETSVRGVVGDDWAPRFDAVLAAACDCTTTTAQRSVNQTLLFEYANAMLLGLATLHARSLDATVVPLVVWDGRETESGGTTLAVQAWRQAGHAVQILDIESIVSTALTVVGT